MGKEEQEEQEERGIAGGDGLSGAFDDVLWHCLRVVGLEEKVRSLPNALDFAVDVAGQNFSVGERQLITLARVLVPSRPCSLADWAPPRILLCDEATANIDVLTDEKAGNNCLKFFFVRHM